MCPSEFAKIGGGIFLTLAFLGIIHVLGPTEAASFFGSVWWFDWSEIVLFGLFGSILLGVVRVPVDIERPAVLWVGWLLLFFSVWSLFFDTFLTIHFERPVEPLFFFLLGIWAHLSGLCAEPGEHSNSVI